MNRDILKGLARCTEARTNRWLGRLTSNPAQAEEAQRRYADALKQYRYGCVRWRAMRYDRALRG
jgi:hypothetical protein